jgi:hypothetical protein
MYKCGWNGCEKAYGTLNHLNAHVTMQSHGSKRTPEGKSTTSTYYLAFDSSLVALPVVMWLRGRDPGVLLLPRCLQSAHMRRLRTCPGGLGQKYRD